MAHRQFQLTKDSASPFTHGPGFTEKDASFHMCTWSARKVSRTEKATRELGPFKILKSFAVPMHCQCNKGKVVFEGGWVG